MKIPFTLNRLLVIVIIHGLCFSQVTGVPATQEDKLVKEQLSEPTTNDGDQSGGQEELLDVDLTTAPDKKTWLLIAGGIILLALVLYFVSSAPSEVPADTGIGQPPDWPY